MTLEESIKAKKDSLKAAIADAQAKIDDPDATPEDAQSALDAVKQIEKDIKGLQDLLEANPNDPAEPENDSTPVDGAPVDPDSETTPSEPDTPDTGNDVVEPDGAPIDPDSETTPSEEETDKKKDEERGMPIKVNETKKNEYRSALNAFLRTKGEKRDGLTSTDTGALIPEQIIYNPETEIHTQYDLGAMVTNQKVSVPSGKYPITSKVSATVPTVAELENNPELAKPAFTNVAWEVVTHRGVVPISQESLDDAEIDVAALVGSQIQEMKLNTINAKVNAVLGTFEAEPLTQSALIDELKTLKNTHFDPAYNLAFVMTQSLFNVLDTMKDNEGRYYLKDDVTAASGKQLFGLQITVIKDTDFGGTAGSKQVFIGDLKRAVFLANRLDATARWVDNDIYGQVLQVAFRNDVKKADTAAGVFATLATPANA